MPGSKRRALKKLLSPNSSPSKSTPTEDIISPTELPSTISDSALSQAVAAGISAEEVQQSAVLEEMADRVKDIGNHAAPPEIAVQESTVMQDTDGMHDSNLGGMYGGGMYGNRGGQGSGKKKKSSRQRFEERQARKQEEMLKSEPPADPNWTAQLERERQEEIKVISAACNVLGREIFEIAPDGHCMYAAIGDQLGQIGLISPDEANDPKAIRKYTSDYMLAHPDDFIPFLPSITGEDSAGATDDGIMTPEGFKQYCQMVSETGEWGGEPEIQALSRAFNIPIHVIQRGPPIVVSHGGRGDSFGGTLTAEQSKEAGDRVVRISYHRRMYGLGEHYNSLRLFE
ncbi:hypothetical protein L204_105338 [Cryptococcus depauperatus]